MKHRPFLLYTVAAMALLLILMLGAFAAGLVLAPYVGQEAQAAPISETALPAAQAGLPLDQADPLAAYEQAMIDLYQTAVPSVVNIRVTRRIEHPTMSEEFDFDRSPFGQDPELPPEEFFGQGQGSGFVWDKEGHIITNHHVVASASEVEVIFSDGRRASAEILGTDPNADLAVVKVNLPAAELQPLPLGETSSLKPGQVAIAIGNPFGQDFTMTTGIISAVDRTIRSGNGPFSIPEVIQTDAAINPGNSGGPLLNRQGEVIGINTQIISRSGGSSGVGFAVPINIAKRVVPTLIEGETYEYSWLGISGANVTPEVADMMELPGSTRGVLIIAVTQDSPADKASLQGSDKTLTVGGQEYQLGGDIITHINGQPVNTIEQLISYLVENTQPGDEVELDLVRPNGQTETITVPLAVRPAPNAISQEN